MNKFGLEHYRKFNGAPLEVHGRSGSEPTFWEFVQGIVREGKYVNIKYDMHTDFLSHFLKLICKIVS